MKSKRTRGGSSTTPKKGGRKVSQSSRSGVTPKIYTHNKIVNNSKDEQVHGS